MLFLASITPLIISLVLVEGYLHQSITQFVPTWNDEVSNWHQTLTFSQVGFQGGYYTVVETPAKASFSHFYVYGPWYPMLYGTIAALTGWTAYTAPLLNWFFISLSLAAFAFLLRLKNLQIFLLMLIMATFWPLLLYGSTNMQEGLQQANTIILAIIFVTVLQQQERLPRKWRWLFLIVITWITLLRLSWAIFYVPFFCLTAPKTFRDQIIALLKSVIAMILVIALFLSVGAPGTAMFPLFAPLTFFHASIGEGLIATVRYALFNAYRFFNVSKEQLDVLQTIQVTTLILWSLVLLAVRPISQRLTLTNRLELAFHLYNLGVIVLAHFVLYQVGQWRDYRVIAGHILLSVLVLLARGRFRMVSLFIVGNILFLSAFLNTFTDFMKPKFSADKVLLQTFEERVIAKLCIMTRTPSTLGVTPCCSVSRIITPYLWAYPLGLDCLCLFRLTTRI